MAAETQDMRERCNKSSGMLGGNRADNEEGQRRFPPPELQVGLRRGERGSVPWGVGSKPDTSKSLHMGNLYGRGASFLLGRTSCEPWRLITIVGLGQFRWQKCLCLHFCCQTQAYLCNINMTKLVPHATFPILTQLCYTYDFIYVNWIWFYLKS